MKRVDIITLLIASALLALTASACQAGGGPAPAPSESASPVPATAAPSSGINTPVAVGTTLPAPSVPATAGLPKDLAKAVSSTKDALAVRFEVSSTVTYAQNGKQVVQQGVNVKGEGNGPDQNLTFSTPNLATGKVETFELIKIGDQSYAKGLSFGPNLDANTWYLLPTKTNNPPGSTANPQGILSGMQESDFLSADFKPSGNGMVDTQSCQVWASQDLALAKRFGNLTNNPDALGQLSAVDAFQVKMWTCPDGYLHQVQGVISGHDSKSSGDKASVEFGYHFYDFGAKIAITAPPNPQPVPVIGPILTATP